MSETNKYIQKLLALLTCTSIFLFASLYVPFFYVAPVMLLTFGLVVSRVMGQKPKELFHSERQRKFFEKGGWRDLLWVIFTILGFVHDLGVWLLWSASQVFLMFVDLVSFIKQILFWIVSGILWLLKKYVPMWRLLFWFFIHYLIRWPWWIYRNAYGNFKFGYQPNFLRIALPSAFITLFTIHVFYFLSIVLEKDFLFYIGWFVAVLPVSWVFGEISSIRSKGLESAPWAQVRHNMQNGLESVRGVLFFIIFFMVLLILQCFLNLLGFLPDKGLIVLGFVFNLNFLISIVLFLLAFIVLFGAFVIPTFRIYNRFCETSFKDVAKLLKFTIRKMLQYLLSLIPTSFFSLFVSFIPVAILFFAFLLSYQVKERIVDAKIQNLSAQNPGYQNELEAQALQFHISDLEELKDFPLGKAQEYLHLNQLYGEIDLLKQMLDEEQALVQLQGDSISTLITQLEMQVEAEKNGYVINNTRLDHLVKTLHKERQKLSSFTQETERQLALEKAMIDHRQKRSRQLPAMFYLTGFFAVVLFSLAFCFVLAYQGNVFYEVYHLRNHVTPSYWVQKVNEEKSRNINQPLLSITVNILTIILVLALVLEYL